jgi:hypothetical protein
MVQRALIVEEFDQPFEVHNLIFRLVITHDKIIRLIDISDTDLLFMKRVL